MPIGDLINHHIDTSYHSYATDFVALVSFVFPGVPSAFSLNNILRSIGVMIDEIMINRITDVK